MKNIRVFYLKIFNFLEMKFSVYLNRRVFVMGALCCYANALKFYRLKIHGPTGRAISHAMKSMNFLDKPRM